MTFYPSYQPFGARYFASRVQLDESDIHGKNADVAIVRLPMQSMSAPLQYLGTAFGQRVGGEAAKRLKELIAAAAVHAKHEITEAQLKEAIGNDIR